MSTATISRPRWRAPATISTSLKPIPRPPAEDSALSRAIAAADGRVGTRNEIWIIPTVGCVARTAQKIAERAASRHAGRVDGVHAFVHPFGCSQLGDDLAGTRAVLAALASHPNAGGVLIVGLGCESNQMKALLAEVDPAANVRTLGAQEAEDEIEEGLALVDALVETAGRAKREAVPLSELVLGVKCGGSDGLSGLTANPLVGRMSDAVTDSGRRRDPDRDSGDLRRRAIADGPGQPTRECSARSSAW